MSSTWCGYDFFGCDSGSGPTPPTPGGDRPWYDPTPTTVYIGNWSAYGGSPGTPSDTDGDGTINFPYATTVRAEQDISWLNGYDGGSTTFMYAPGTFAAPNMNMGVNFVTMQGYLTTDATYAITTVVSATDAAGIVLDLTVTGLSADALRGKVILYSGGAPNGRYGVIERSDASGGGVTRVYVTQDNATNVSAPVAGTTSIIVYSQATIFQISSGQADWNTMSELFINDIEWQGSGGNRALFIQGGGGKIVFQRCRFTTNMGRLAVEDGGNAWLVCCYAAFAGTSGMLDVAGRHTCLRVGRGTVVDGVNSGTPFVLVSPNGLLQLHAETAMRALGTNGIRVDGGDVALVSGVRAHDTLRFDTCLAGIIVNPDISGSVNDRPGGFHQFPNLYGWGGSTAGVRSVYCVTSQRGGYTRIGGLSSCPTGNGSTTYGTGTINAVSADAGGSNIAQNGADATLIYGGSPSATGWESGAVDDIWQVAGNITSNSGADSTIATDSFVFGSTSLNDTGSAANDVRFEFEKSSGAFRAGSVTGTQWDTRGTASTAFGAENTATGNYSHVPGGLSAIASHYGEMAFGSGVFAATGDAQQALVTWRASTTNATPAELFLDGAGASARFNLANNSMVGFVIRVNSLTSAGVARKDTFEGCIKRGANAAATALVGAPLQTTFADAGLVAATVAITADTTNGSILITVTGIAATNIRWVASGILTITAN